MLVAALVVPAVANASRSSSGTGGGGSSVDQYVEKVPTASGSKAVRNGKKTAVKLPTKAKNALKKANSKTRETLIAFAHSSGFGALPIANNSPKDPNVGSVDSSVVKSFGAVIASFGAGSTTRLVVLLIAIVGTTAVVGIVAIRRQRILP